MSGSGGRILKIAMDNYTEDKLRDGHDYIVFIPAGTFIFHGTTSIASFSFPSRPAPYSTQFGIPLSALLEKYVMPWRPRIRVYRVEHDLPLWGVKSIAEVTASTQQKPGTLGWYGCRNGGILLDCDMHALLHYKGSFTFDAVMLREIQSRVGICSSLPEEKPLTLFTAPQDPNIIIPPPDDAPTTMADCAVEPRLIPKMELAPGLKLISAILLDTAKIYDHLMQIAASHDTRLLTSYAMAIRHRHNCRVALFTDEKGTVKGVLCVARDRPLLVVFDYRPDAESSPFFERLSCNLDIWLHPSAGSSEASASGELGGGGGAGHEPTGRPVVGGSAGYSGSVASTAPSYAMTGQTAPLPAGTPFPHAHHTRHHSAVSVSSFGPITNKQSLQQVQDQLHQQHADATKLNLTQEGLRRDSFTFNATTTPHHHRNHSLDRSRDHSAGRRSSHSRDRHHSKVRSRERDLEQFEQLAFAPGPARRHSGRDH